MFLSDLTQTRLLWAALLLLTLGLAWLIGPVLLPFAAALILAYGMHPSVERLRRLGLPRALGAALAVLLVCAALLALGNLIWAVLADTLPRLQQQAPMLAQRLSDWSGLELHFDPGWMKQKLAQSLFSDPERWAEQLLNSARNGGGTVLSVLGNLLLIPVLTFYLLLDWDALLARAFSLVPPGRQFQLKAFVDECDHVLGRYLRGQVLVMLLLAAYYSVALTLAGFELALPIGAFTGLAVCIPFLGFSTGLVLALLAGALQFQSLYALGAVALVYGIGQILESSILVPKLLGHQIGLHPLLVILLLLSFGHLFGLVGVLLALPTGALLTVVARHLLAWYRHSPMYRNH